MELMEVEMEVPKEPAFSTGRRTGARRLQREYEPTPVPVFHGGNTRRREPRGRSVAGGIHEDAAAAADRGATAQRRGPDGPRWTHSAREPRGRSAGGGIHGDAALGADRVRRRSTTANLEGNSRET